VGKKQAGEKSMNELTFLAEQSLVYRLLRRAEIRRQIPGRKSVQEGASDKIADLLEEAANEIERLQRLQNENDVPGWC